MSSKHKKVPYEKYLLVDWKSGDRSVVNEKQVVSPLNQELRVGVMVTLERGDKMERATVIGTSRDPDILERQICREPDTNYPNKQEIEIDKDFSASASSWSPSDDNSESESEEEVKPKRVCLPLLNNSTIRNSKKVMTPVHRPPAIIPNTKPKILNGTIDNVNKRDRVENHVITKHKPKKSTSMLLRKVNMMMDSFKKLIGIVDNMKIVLESGARVDRQIVETDSGFQKKTEPKTVHIATNQDKYEEKLQSDEEYFENEFNRSDDNVLITNKYDVVDKHNASAQNKITKGKSNITDKQVRDIDINDSVRQTETKEMVVMKLNNAVDTMTKQKESREKEKAITMKTELNEKVYDYAEQKEPKETIRSISKSKHLKDADKYGPDWIPIGSGATKIHMTKFRNVNWKSYTVATRTLLLALFPRKILATHSLTGKRSPAFQNKPAKMCLDPKIVSDVLIEITDRFKVKENLVRSIITTKCADECKMYKSRQMRKTMAVAYNQENIPPTTSQVADENMIINRTL